MITSQDEILNRPTTNRTGAVVARLTGVSKTFGPVRALHNVDLNVHAGEVLAVLGPNGAGKTTTVKLLLGLASPSAGAVRVFGSDPRMPINRLRTGAMLQVGRVPETLQVQELIDLFSSYYVKPLRIHETLAAAGLEGIERRRFGVLSGGQKQRVLFALAICGDPDLLFLDEPTVGLDVEARHILWDEIRQLVSRGKTVLLTTHDLHEADALADRIVVIHRGAILAEGAPAEIKARTAGRQIRCTTRLSIATLCSLPGVLEVHSDRLAFLIRTAVAEPVLRELFRRDPEVSEIDVTSAGLEEAFLALTRDNEAHSVQP